MLVFQCCIDIDISTPMICCDMNLLSNVQIILVQRCEFDVVLSTLSKRFELYVIISTLQQRCSTPSVELIVKR